MAPRKNSESWLQKMLRKRHERRMFSESSTQNIFQWIYRTNKWGDPESLSGSGSNLQQTRTLRAELPDLLRRLGIESLLDAPCGDFYWMQHTDLAVERYIGADIVPELIDKNKQEHAAPGRSFICLDLAHDPLPAADAILCRDCLVHLDLPTNAKVIRNIKASSCRYLLTTSHRLVAENVEKVTGKHRLLNLQLPPFGWPEPVEIIVEDLPPSGRDTGRILGVWRVSDIAPPTIDGAHDRR